MVLMIDIQIFFVIKIPQLCDTFKYNNNET